MPARGGVVSWLLATIRLHAEYPTDRDSLLFFFFSSRRRHTRCSRDWSSDVCSSDLTERGEQRRMDINHAPAKPRDRGGRNPLQVTREHDEPGAAGGRHHLVRIVGVRDRKSTRLNSSHGYISYAVFCLKKKK